MSLAFCGTSFQVTTSLRPAYHLNVCDARGVRNPKAENLVRFAVEGPGRLVAVANANPVSTESYQQPRRKAWRGRCLLVVKSDRRAGRINVRATAEGLAPATLVINSYQP